jgi:hypothetical protein
MIEAEQTPETWCDWMDRHDMAPAQVADGNINQLWRIAANILNEQL